MKLSPRALKLIDANVLIYAAGGDHPYKEPCLRFLQSVREGSQQATADVEVLQEILHYYQRRSEVVLGVDVVNHALTLFPEPLIVSVADVIAAGDLMQRNPSLEARDAIHAAVVLQHGLEGIISADRGFDAVPEISRFDPKDL